MICPACGKTIKDEAIFCIHCGSKVPRCPTCGKVFDKPVRFCGNDGTPLPEEMFAALANKKNIGNSDEERPHIQPVLQKRQVNNVQSADKAQELESPEKAVSVPVKKKNRKPLVLILIGILLLLMVGIGIVIGICFPDTLKDLLPESVAGILLQDDDEQIDEEAIDSNVSQQDLEEVETDSEELNEEVEETTEGAASDAVETQEQESAEEEDSEEAGIEEEAAKEDTEVAEDTSGEEVTAAEEEELDMVLIFILNSDCYYFTEEDIADFDAEMCRLARNGIYAKMGRKFNDTSLTEYFSQYDWYEPTIEASDFSESMLNEYQIANRNLIVAFETAQGYR